MKIFWALFFGLCQPIFGAQCPVVNNSKNVAKALNWLADHITAEHYLEIDKIFTNPGDHELVKRYGEDILSGGTSISGHVDINDVIPTFLYALNRFIGCFGPMDAAEYSERDEFGKTQLVGQSFAKLGKTRSSVLFRVGQLYRDALQAQKKTINDRFTKRINKAKKGLAITKGAKIKKEGKIQTLEREKKNEIKLMKDKLVEKIGSSLIAKGDQFHQTFVNFLKHIPQWRIFMKRLFEGYPQTQGLINAMDRIEKDGLTIQGIFRQSGAKDETDKIITAIKQGKGLSKILERADPIAIAVAVKYSLESYFANWIDPSEALKVYEGNDDYQNEYVEGLMNRLGESEKAVFCRLGRLLQKIIEKKDVNLMNWKNLAIVIAPRFIPDLPLSGDLNPMIQVQIQSKLIPVREKILGSLFNRCEGVNIYP